MGCCVDVGVVLVAVDGAGAPAGAGVFCTVGVCVVSGVAVGGVGAGTAVGFIGMLFLFFGAGAYIRRFTPLAQRPHRPWARCE